MIHSLLRSFNEKVINYQRAFRIFLAPENVVVNSVYRSSSFFWPFYLVRRRKWAGPLYLPLILNQKLMIKRALTTWKKLSQKASKIQTSAFLIFFYLVILFPVGIIFRIFTDILRNKKKPSTQWLKRERRDFTFEDLKTQY